MLIYNVASLQKDESGQPAERLAAVEWSRDGQQAVLYLDGAAQALVDFATRSGFCRMNFPNYLPENGDTWQRASHAWNDQALARFENALYK
jgi:hypothetical protein